MFFAVVLLNLSAFDVPMPPPPPGMMLLAQAPAPVVVIQPDAGVPAARLDGGVPAMATDDSDDDVDAMRALEEVAIDPPARNEAVLRSSVALLPYNSLVRDQLETALDQADQSGEALPFSLALVTDVSSFDVSLVRDRYDIPVEMQPLVAQYIHFFQTGGRKWFRRWMSRSYRFIPLMRPILEAQGLPRDTVYLAMIESGFNTQAKSWAKAVGPWQFIAGTAVMFKLKEDFWIDERRDPILATEAAGKYLDLLYKTLGHWYLAWAGYNTGGGRVRWMIDKYGTKDFWALSEKKGLAKETKHYVPKLIACALVAKHPEAFGFAPDEFENEPVFEFDEVPLNNSVDLEVLAASAGTTVDVLQELNPAVKRWCTPPATDEKPYVFRIPKGSKETFAQNFAKVAPTERLNFKIHRVGKGDTLSKIAGMYHSAQEAIMRMNGLSSARSLRVGTDLIVPMPSANAIKAGRADTSFERQVVKARRAGLVAVRPEEEIPAGSVTSNVKTTTSGTVRLEKIEGKNRVTYGVAPGDSLWTIARRFDVRVADLRSWNESLGPGGRGLKIGTSLVIFPGPAADLSKARGSTGSP